MERVRKRWRLLAGGLSGLAAGIAGGIVAIALLAGGARGDGNTYMTAAHVPPLLTLQGEPVTLRYAIVCPPPVGSGSPTDGACDGAGDVYVRTGGRGTFEHLPLSRGPESAAGRYVVSLPDRIASAPDGFSYYAVLRDAANGGAIVLPSGGADAPQRSYRLLKPVTVNLGTHVFGAAQAPSARVVDARWGSGPSEVGLSGGPTSLRIGPSSFDVAADGSVSLLDGVNARVERWRAGRAIAAVAVDVPAATNDLAVAPDGTMFVLDGTSGARSTPLLQTFAASGLPIRARHIAERTWSQLRLGPRGPIVQQEPSEQWMPAQDGATPLDRAAQARAGTSGRPLADGSSLVVLRVGTREVRLARVVDGSVRASWRIVSPTPLGEVQLADQSGNRLVLVVKTYTESRDEFEVLVLDGHRLVRRFAVASDQWADAAPLAYFRLAGGSLYKLGTSSAGAFVDRYDLEGPR